MKCRQRLTQPTDPINDPRMATQPEQQIALAPGPWWVSADGDAALYAGEAIATLSRIPDESVDCVWTDPPYLLSNGGITCVAGRMVSVDKGDWDKSRGLELDHQFNLEWTAECYRILKPTGTIWVTGTLHVYPSVGMALLRNGFRLLNDIVWEKPNPPPNLGCRTFTHSTEIALWASKAPKGSRHKYTFNYEEMKRENGGKQMKTVWTMTAPGKAEKLHGKHPTQKPVKLIDRCLRASTNPGDLVLDPFAGSGSAGVAALAIGRRFVGIEMNAEYAEIARLRMAEIDHSFPPPPPTLCQVARLQAVACWSPAAPTTRRNPTARGRAKTWLGATRQPARLWRRWCFQRSKWADTRFVTAWTSARASESRATA